MRNELNDSRWHKLRAYILMRDKYLDQEAIRYGKRIEASVVHHIFPREYFPQYTYSAWNLISVSHKTHNTLHDRESHRLTHKGFDLMLRTARKQKIELPDHIKELVCA